MSSGERKQSEFRRYLPDLSTSRFSRMQQQNCHQYAAEFRNEKNPPWLHTLYEYWQELLQEPLRGITNDGIVRSNLFQLADEGIPIDVIVSATQKLTQLLSKVQLEKTLYHIDSPEWRTWSNPEFLLSDKGLRLDELDDTLKFAILDILRASLSPEGYHKALSAMRMNGFLGELIGAERVCNEFSYNFVIFGLPSTKKPWGFSFYGHHLCLNLFFYKSQLVLAPWFTGAEPNEIDIGPYMGTKILQKEDQLGLKFMQSLSEAQQSQAQVYKLLHDPNMPIGRWNRDDQRHLCGAYRDNRVVPYEGVSVISMSNEQIHLLEEIIMEFLLYLPIQARKMRLAHIRQHFAETFFCWIGGFQDNDAFYYRIQSPVLIVEFDHHSGVFLNNEDPARFHIHTLLRIPNAGDYGRALLPLIPGEHQAFSWNNDEQAKDIAHEAGFQEK